ncbi:hypothetical protein [Desulfoscipio geothermicus]|uniref:Uncharacterized protein n=1 Tax=Desulfoscipio geothermicus DSM 3669 TaxID=1121426 RepID=A0A1I6E1C1_9FIRM|nr:hypothetical protein [Desulfoscipio geothermicus]SFR11574.1 hypothetical protein SAMN05660706_12314 [Desulfoscipio geothermicus DSM 3669]
MAVEEVRREIAATGEVPPELPPHWFLYLVERMDRMENNLRAEFKQEITGLRSELKQDISDVRNDVRSLRVQQFAVISGLVLTFAGVFYGLLTR